MRLSKIKLCNYRCFGACEQTIPIDDLTTFIGNNSSGKTAALAALNCMFSENGSDRLLQRSDFHLPKDVSPETLECQSLYVEAVFEFDELQSEQHGGEQSVPEYFQHLVVDGPDGSPYLRIRMDATWEKSNTVEGSIESQIRYVTCPESVPVTEDSFTVAHRRELDKIRVIYIPAVRDPSRQLRNTSGTMMYQIMSNINWSETTRDSVKAKIQQLNDAFEQESGVSIFGSSINKQWKSYDSDDRYSNATLRFNSTDIETSIKKAEVVFLPTVTGKEYTIDQMSDGLRSLFYISLVDSILDVEQQIKRQLEIDPEHVSFNRAPPILTVVAIEEPENHIAPHLLGRLIENLRSISKKNNAQAIMTSHSPAIVKRVDPETIRYFRLDADAKTNVRSITLPSKESAEDQYKYIKEAIKAYPELYFSKLVILGEGDSEEILLPKFLEICNGNTDLCGISVVPLGGKHVNHFWRLLNDLHIPHLTLLDLDREREMGGWGRIKYVLTQLLQYGSYCREDLLLTSDGVLSDEALSNMHEWDVTDEKAMQSWLERLEGYNVFFSSPLDIDFLMLEHYGDVYKKLPENKEGPRLRVSLDGNLQTLFIRDIETSQANYPEYSDRVESDVKRTLKECGGDGSTYTSAQKQLMIWYNYFFLNRGKPSTHIAVLSAIDEEQLKQGLPPVFMRLIAKAKRIIGDTDENNSARMLDTM